MCKLKIQRTPLPTPIHQIHLYPPKSHGFFKPQLHCLLQDDHLSSLRRRNKTLILVFFSLVILLALIIGAIIISLVHQHNSQSQSPNPVPAIQEFCSQSESSCITSLYSAVEIPPNGNPNQIFILSLETSVKDLFTIISMASSIKTRRVTAFVNCSSLLSHAVGQLNNILRAMRVNPDLETQTYGQRGDMVRWINVALEDLASCAGDLGKVESTAAVGEVSAKAHGLRALVRYSKDFLVDCDIVNENFRFFLL